VIALWFLGACAPAGLDGFWVVLDGRVVGEDDEPLAGATVTLAAGDGTQVAELDTDTGGEWRLPLYGDTLDDNVLVALVRADGYAEGRATYEVNLRSPEVTTLRAGPVQTWEPTTRRLATVRLGLDGASATVAGHVVDAVTGAAVADVPLSLQAGWNASVGDSAVGSARSGSAGDFHFDVDKPGMYTVTASAAGDYGAARFPAFLSTAGGQALGVVGPPTVPGELRASLTWAATPSDLDLHLSAPLKGGIAGEDGNGQFHVWSGAPRHPEDVDEADVEARMEITDADGRGPETVWVGSVADRGDLRLTAFDNDNRSDADTTALAGSDAVIQVWFGEDIPRFYTVSPGETATLWRPVEIDVATQLTYPVEEYTVGDDPADPDAF
jgi:hypothetical protein